MRWGRAPAHPSAASWQASARTCSRSCPAARPPAARERRRHLRVVESIRRRRHRAEGPGPERGQPGRLGHRAGDRRQPELVNARAGCHARLPDDQRLEDRRRARRSPTTRQHGNANNVAVIGQTVATNLFPDGQSPIGQLIRIRNVPFTVVGVLASKGSTGFGDQDDTIMIPFQTGQVRLFGRDVDQSDRGPGRGLQPDRVRFVRDHPGAARAPPARQRTRRTTSASATTRTS